MKLLAPIMNEMVIPEEENSNGVADGVSVATGNNETGFFASALSHVLLLGRTF